MTTQRQWLPLVYMSVADLPIGLGPGKIPTSDMVAELIGQATNVYLPVHNATGGLLLRGRLVAVTGSTVVAGLRRYTIDYADKDDTLRYPASAILQEDLPAGEDTYALVGGILTDVDTSAFVLTDQLCLGNNGFFLLPPPQQDPFTGIVQTVGVVVNVGVADGAIQILIQGQDTLTAAQQFNAPQTLGRGWQEGGALTRGGGLTLNVAGGVGFPTDSFGQVKRVVWLPQVIILPPESPLTIFVDEFGVAQSLATLVVDTDTNIVLGRARTDAASISFLSFDSVQIQRRNAKFNDFATEVTGCVAFDGVVGQPNGGDALRLDVSGGTFWINDDRVTVPGTAPITFTYWFQDGAGGWSTIPGSTHIDNARYDDGTGVLAPIPAGEWKQDILFATSADETGLLVEYHVVYAQQTLATQPLAEAGGLPVPPVELQRFSLRSTGAVLQVGSPAIASVIDQRPFLGGLATGSAFTSLASLTGTISDAQHGNRGGGALHAVATGVAAGFMSAADKVKLDGTVNTVVFSGSGILGVVDNVGMWWWNRTGRTLTLTDVTMWRQQAGISGSTIGDVELDAGGTGAAFVSVYLPANRPTVLFSAGANATVQANTFATTAVPNGAILRFNLDQVEGGSPQNILAQLTLQ